MKISKIIILVLCVLTMVISCDKKPSYKEAPFDGSNVVIDAKTMKEGAAEFYSLVLDGIRINFDGKYIIKKDDIKAGKAYF